MHVFSTFVKNHLAVDVLIYFKDLCFVPLVFGSAFNACTLVLNYCSFVMFFNISWCKTYKACSEKEKTNKKQEYSMWLIIWELWGKERKDIGVQWGKDILNAIFRYIWTDVIEHFEHFYAKQTTPISVPWLVHAVCLINIQVDQSQSTSLFGNILKSVQGNLERQLGASSFLGKPF